MLIQKCKGFSGYFQFKNGKLQYINPKANDFFEIDTNFIQALHLHNIEGNKTLTQLDIIGNYQVIKSIQLPIQFAKDVKYWIYLNLHFLSRKDTQSCHKDVQPVEVIQYRRSQRIRAFCFVTICLLLFAGLSRSISYSYQISQLKTEARYLKIPELLIESKKQVDNDEFNESIHSLLLANAIQPSQKIRDLLDDAYLKRGKYYISKGIIPLAKKDFLHIKGLKKETISLLSTIEQYEAKKWLRFSDLTDLVLFTWDTVKNNLDNGKNKARSEELARTWSEFQEKLNYTAYNHPFLQAIKDFFFASVY